MRKAIGWALGERSYTAPTEVVRYCERQGARLSPLSRHEALKVVNRHKTRGGSGSPGLG